MDIDLHAVHLFAALDEDQIRRLLESSHTITLQNGQHLFETGDRAERFFLVLSGQLKPTASGFGWMDVTT
jgi:CRP-like cAMP-binding protein